MPTPCLCGCGRVTVRRYVQGHNRRQPWTWTIEDRGYETSCWIWDRRPRAKGYGGVRVDGKTRSAHRAVYERLKGPIPDGLELDHLCCVRECVNPDHLEPVTTQENIRRSNAPAALNARKTHCVHGHEFTAENTHIRPTGARACRACMKAYSAAYYRSNREKSAA